MKNICYQLLLLMLTIALFLCLPQAALADSPKDILVVCNKGVKIDSVTRDEIKNLFLYKRKRWKDGSKAIPVNAPDKSDLRADFDRRVLLMSPDDELSYWYNYSVRTGQPAPPAFRSTQKAVFKMRNSVSYVYRLDFKKNVSKVLLVVPAE